MKLRILLLGIFTALSLLTANAQVSVGRNCFGRFKDFKKGEYKTIKNKKTIFVVDDFSMADFSDMVKDAWKFNDYEVVSRADFQKDRRAYVTDKNAICEMTGFIRTITHTGKSSYTSEYLYVYLRYYYPTNVRIKKDKLVFDTNEIAAVFFGGNTDAMWRMVREAKFGDIQADLYNYKLGYFKNYLQYISSTLAEGWYSFAYDNNYEVDKLKKVKQATLYVPDYFKIKSNWGWSDSERKNPEDLFKKYPFKYEFISDDALNKKILEGSSEDFYYLTYVKVNSQKMISITNGKTGEMIYKDYQTMSYQIKPKDITKLGKKVKK